MEKKISKVLFLGVLTSSLLIILGLFLAVLNNDIEMSYINNNFRNIFNDIFNLKASGFLFLGIFLLILTPIIRVIGMLIQYIIEKDKNFVIISVTILVILSISLFLGTTH